MDACVWFGSHLKYRYVCLSNFPFKVFPRAASRACVTIATPIWQPSGCGCGCGCVSGGSNWKLFHFHFHSIMWDGVGMMGGWGCEWLDSWMVGWVVISAGSLKCLHSHHRATYKRWAGCIGLWQLDEVNKINQVCIYATSRAPRLDPLQVAFASCISIWIWIWIRVWICISNCICVYSATSPRRKENAKQKGAWWASSSCEG